MKGIYQAILLFVVVLFSYGQDYYYSDNRKISLQKSEKWIVVQIGGEDHSRFEKSVELVNGLIVKQRFSRQQKFYLLEALKTSLHPFALFLDLRFEGGLQGENALGEIHALAPATQVIVLTFRDDEKTVRRVFEQGVAGYLCKPYEDKHILGALNDVRFGIFHFSKNIAPVIQDTFMNSEQNTGRAYPLSRQERKILPYLIQDVAVKDIAQEMNNSYHTIHNHFTNIYKKLNVNSREDARRKIIDEQLIPSENKPPA